MSQCKTCRAPLTWCETVNGKKMPLDAKPIKAIQVKEGIGEVIDVYLPHWATCPGADKHRKER
ncbi:MAG: hypothetical protein H8E10_16875 [Desulfobacterales bacterium]|nr:hypothetical protein [Desulfobacterales bacterium]